MKYRKKPIIVDAFKWMGGQDQSKYPEWLTEAIKRGKVFFLYEGTLKEVLVLDVRCETAGLGDYIAMDEYGAMSAHSPKGFEAMYEKVEGKI